MGGFVAIATKASPALVVSGNGVAHQSTSAQAQQMADKPTYVELLEKMRGGESTKPRELKYEELLAQMRLNGGSVNAMH